MVELEFQDIFFRVPAASLADAKSMILTVKGAIVDLSNSLECNESSLFGTGTFVVVSLLVPVGFDALLVLGVVVVMPTVGPLSDFSRVGRQLEARLSLCFSSETTGFALGLE